MSGRRAKDLRGHGKNQIKGGRITVDRANLLETAAILTARLQKQVKKQYRWSRYSQLVLTMRCAGRKVKALYMAHKARTGVSL